MNFTITITVLALAAASHAANVSEVDGPKISWGKEYHYNAEEVDLVSSIVKPIEIWYSKSQRRSRLDTYGGSTKRYYYGPRVVNHKLIGSRAYMFQPVSNENEDPVVVCLNLISYFDDIFDFLPKLTGFKYSGVEGKSDGHDLLKYTKNETKKIYDIHEELYVINKDGIGILFKHTSIAYSTLTGNIMANKIVNYYNYDDKIGPHELDVDESSCREVRKLDEAMHILNPEVPSDLEFAFLGFKNKHNKEYNDMEHEYRKTIFEMNWRKVVEHNSKNLGYEMAINKFSDQTPEELTYLDGIKYSEPIRGTAEFPYSLEEVNRMAKELPEYFDLRDEAIISPVRSQGACGSCWAFAATATMEAAVARNNGGRVLDLSEQSLLDCAWQYGSSGCQGSDGIAPVFQYVVDYGIPTVEEYGPYLQEGGRCHIKNMNHTYKAKAYVVPTPKSPNALKTALHKYGPITVGVMSTDNLKRYSSGIFYDFECEPNRINHAVVLVGYGSNGGELYWIIKNSWGQDWGESGYFRITATDNNCNIMTYPVYPLI